MNISFGDLWFLANILIPAKEKNVIASEEKALGGYCFSFPPL
jgi:hypothetical protein